MFERFDEAYPEKLCIKDQDDVWKKDKVEIALGKMKASLRLLIYSDLKLVNHKLEMISESFWGFENIKSVAGKPWLLLLSQNIVTGCTVIVKNKLKKYALPFPVYIEMHDWWLSFAASIYGEIDYIEDQLVEYRQHTNNAIGFS